MATGLHYALRRIGRYLAPNQQRLLVHITPYALDRYRQAISSGVSWQNRSEHWRQFPFSSIVFPRVTTVRYEAFELAEQLRVMEPSATQPRDLPGRYGRVIRDLERLLIAADALAVVVGGWAVWHHGFAGRVTEDVDVVVPRDKIGALQQLSGLCGFDVLALGPGRWPKLSHRETAIVVDFLPEAEFPGTSARPGLVAIGHPLRYRAGREALSYCSLAGLIELKLGAGRTKDAADIIELIKRNPLEIPEIADHLRQLHSEYAARFTALVELARTET